MRVIADAENDTLYIRLSDAEIRESEEVEPGLIVDYDADGRVVALEIMHVSRRIGARQGAA